VVALPGMSRLTRSSPTTDLRIIWKPARDNKESRPSFSIFLLVGSRHVVRYTLRPQIESRPAIISEGRRSVAAIRFSRRCSIEDVPGINRMLPER
jgi:hypothetical protein